MDRPLRALQRVALQNIGKRKKKQQQRAFERLPDNPGADRCQHHKNIHIEHPAAQGSDRRAHTLLTTENIGSCIERQCSHRSATEGFLTYKGSDQKSKTQRGGNLLIQGSRPDSAPKPLLRLRQWLVGSHFCSESAQCSHHTVLVRELFIKCQAQDFPDVGRRCFTNAGDFCGSFLQPNRTGLAGTAIQSHRALLKRHIRHMATRDLPQVLLTQCRRIIFDLKRRLARNRLNAHHALVVRDGTRHFLQRLLRIRLRTHKMPNLPAAITKRTAKKPDKSSKHRCLLFQRPRVF